MCKIQSERMPRDKLQRLRNLRQPAEQRPQYGPCQQCVKGFIRPQCAAAGCRFRMLCRPQDEHRRQCPQRQTDVQAQPVAKFGFCQPDTACVEQRPAHKQTDRCDRQNPVQLTGGQHTDDLLHAEGHCCGQSKRHRRMPLCRTAEQLAEQDQLHQYEYVIQVDVAAACQNVFDRMCMRLTEHGVHRKVKDRPEQIRRQHAGKPPFGGLHRRLTAVLQPRVHVPIAGQHDKHRHCKQRQLVAHHAERIRAPGRNVYHHHSQRRNRPQAVHLPNPHVAIPHFCPYEISASSR